MQIADLLPMLHALTKINKGLHFPRGGVGKEGIISKRMALTTFLWEISNRTKTRAPTRQNTLKKTRPTIAGEAESILVTKIVVSWHMIHRMQMEIWWSVPQVQFLLKLPEASFLCVSEKAKVEQTRKKGKKHKRGKDARKQESRQQLQKHHKGLRSRTDFRNVVWKLLRGQVSKVEVMLISQKNLEGRWWRG